MKKPKANPITELPQGRMVHLERGDAGDQEFARQAYGFEAEEQGWFRERDRIFVFNDALSAQAAAAKLKQPPPPGILDMPEPPLPKGPLSRKLLTMDDGAVVRWIRHPQVLPEAARSSWREHFAMLEVKGRDPKYVAYTSIPAFAFLDGADGKFRVFAPGGIRWVDYANQAAAMSDAMDMSLAVAMKIQVVRTPSGGNKISVIGDKADKHRVLRSLFAAYERLGLIVTSADLGLSIEDLKKVALPVAPTCLVPLGVYEKGIPSADVTADAAFAGLKAMAGFACKTTKLDRVSFTMQGIGEVGYNLALQLLEAGARLGIAEVNPQTTARFRKDAAAHLKSGRAYLMDKPDDIYDAPADIFVPCALRDILDRPHLARLKKAGIKLIGGPANNLFPDQAQGPWAYHEAGMPVVPYEGIGAGGVTGVAYSITSGIYGKCPFAVKDKIKLIHDYVDQVLHWSRRYDLPAQVVSDRLLIGRIRRRRILSFAQSEEIMQTLMRAFNQPDRQKEAAVRAEYTKRGFFEGAGRFAGAGQLG